MGTVEKLNSGDYDLPNPPQLADFDKELQMALMNRTLRRDCETIFMMPTLKNSFVSSTLVKEVARLNGNFADYVPPPVARALRAKLGAESR